MGTRGLLGLIIKGVRHGQYNQYDCYPQGLGQGIVNFLLTLTPEEIAEMANLVEDIEWVGEGEGPPPTAAVKERYNSLGYPNLRVSNQSLDDWYCLLHAVQGEKALPAIKKGDLKHLIESVTFLQDTLFCEWAYFVDFDNQTLETWKAGEHLATASFKQLKEYEDSNAYMEGIEDMTYGTYEESEASANDAEDDAEFNTGGNGKVAEQVKGNLDEVNSETVVTEENITEGSAEDKVITSISDMTVSDHSTESTGTDKGKQAATAVDSEPAEKSEAKEQVE